MRRLLELALVVTCLAGMVQAGEVLDRIVAIVNNTPIFQSEWELALRCEALLGERAPESYSTAWWTRNYCTSRCADS
jgi:hypothetical protein